eukprot:gene53580-71608_t
MRLPTLGMIADTHRAVYTSGAPLLLAAVFACYTIIFLAFLTYLNQHLIEIDGFTALESGVLLSVLALFNPVFSLAIGPMVRVGLDPIKGFSVGFLVIAIAASPIFLGLTTPVQTVLLASVTMAALGALPLDGKTVEEQRAALVGRIGENMSIRRFQRFATPAKLTSYLHGTRIGVMVEYDGADEQVGKDVAMHIAAMKPVALSSDQVPADLIEKERSVAHLKAVESGKPADIATKMVEGSVQKYLKE